MSFAPWVAQPPTFCARTTFGYFIFPLPAYAHDFNPDPDAAGRRGDRCRLRVTQAKKSEAENSHRLSLSYLSPSRPEFSFFTTWCLSRPTAQCAAYDFFIYIHSFFYNIFLIFSYLFISFCCFCLCFVLNFVPVVWPCLHAYKLFPAPETILIHRFGSHAPILHLLFLFV